MAVNAEKPLCFPLAGRPLGPGDLIGVRSPDLHQALGHGEHGDLVYRVESTSIAEHEDRKQEKAHADSEGHVASRGVLRRRMRAHGSANHDSTEKRYARLEHMYY